MLGRRLIVAAVAALCLLAPGTAVAAGDDEAEVAAFQLKASNGYRMAVLGVHASGRAHGAVLILVGSKRGSVTYTSSAEVGDNGIRADLGDLGQINLEFVPLEGRETHSCGPGDEVSRIGRGEYRGIFEFHGEEGYTEARATALPTDFGLFLDLVCGALVGYGDASGPGLPGARLNAVSGRTRERLRFEIKKNRPSAPSAFQVSVRERIGGVHVRRTIEGMLGAGAFRYDRRLRTATVAPPAPFDGSASFRRDAPRRNRWTGDLTVDFPGRSGAPLTASGSRVSLVHASWSKSREDRSRLFALGRRLALLEAP